jgi:hypothetical protein
MDRSLHLSSSVVWQGWEVAGHICEIASVTCGFGVEEDVAGLLVPIGAGWRGTLELLVS